MDGRIPTDRNDKDLHPTRLELAKSKGLKTGNVSTAELTDATPAAQMAHVASRSCQGPQNMQACPQDRKANGGPGSIAEQSIDNRVDVLLGGGAARYDQLITEGPDAGQTVAQDAAEDGYRVVRNEGELAAVRPGQRVLGLFNAGNQTQEWTGQLASNPPSGPQVCNEANRDQKATPEPSLSQQTEKAIELLGRRTEVPIRASSCRSRARPYTSGPTPPTRAARSVSSSPSTRPYRWRSTTRASGETRR